MLRRRNRGDAGRTEREIVDAFHRLYYNARDGGGTWFDTWWMGVRTQKCPLDLWIYQELIFGPSQPDHRDGDGLGW